MKAGTALGLLAGLGAMNALRGGRDGTGPRFTGLLDMLDGGGAGQSGDRFEGGGLLSILGNLFAKPMQAQENVERIAQDTAATKVLTEALKQSVVPEQRSSAAMTEMERQRGLLADQFDPRDMQGATDFRTPTPTAVPAGLLDLPDDLVEVFSPAINNGPEEYTSDRRMYQAVPTMRDLDVPEIARVAQGPKFSPLFAADYRDYLEYLNTGRYPRD